MVHIENPKLAELDKKVGDFYSLTARYFKSLANLHGREIYKKGLAELLEKSQKIKPKSQFDKLVLRNIQSNLRLNDMTIDYFTDPDFSMSVKDFFDKLTGEGTFNYLEQRVQSPPWEKRWQYSGKRQERNYANIDPSIEEAQKSEKEWVPKIKRDILDYGKSEGYLPQDFDINIFLLPPGNKEGHSYWDPKTRDFGLDCHEFEFSSENNKVTAIPVKAYSVAFHEVLGHGAHQIHSQQMPYSLRFTEEMGYIAPTKSITEGIAINAEKESYNFLRERLEQLGLDEEDISLLEEGNDLDQQSTIEGLYYALVNDREKREKDFNGYEHILQLTQNPTIAKYYTKRSFRGSWRTMGYALDALHYQKMLDKAEKELGKNYLESKDFHKATLKGVWSWEVYPDAISYMAKNL